MMKPPFWDHASYIRYCARNMRRGQDNVFLYEGEEGSGKSNGAAWDATLIHKELGVRAYDLANDPIFNRPQWVERFDAGEKERVYVLDEFENLAFNRDFNKPDNREFVKLAQQARILRSTILAVMPYLQFADVYFRQGRFRVRVRFERLTDYDLPCLKCGFKHEVREATYYWRQRKEDMETGEVVVSWLEVFTARHCPWALVDPVAWKGYEDRKEGSVRDTALGRKRERVSKEEAAAIMGPAPGPPDPRKPESVTVAKARAKRRAMWGTLSPREKLLSLALAQDAIRKDRKLKAKMIPLTPPKPSNRVGQRRPKMGHKSPDSDSLFNGEPVGDLKPLPATEAVETRRSRRGGGAPLGSAPKGASRPRKRSTRA